MALRATLAREGRDIVLDEDDQATLTLLEELRGRCGLSDDGIGVLECREHDNEPRLEHRRDERGRVHGAWLHVRRLRHTTGGGSYLLLAHNARNDPELKSSTCRLAVGMSDEHKAEQDYLCRTGDRVGFDMSTEHRIPGARLDVYGKTQEAREFGFEVQLSNLSANVAKRRDSSALKVGVPLIWTAKRTGVAWNAERKLAQVTTSDLPQKADLGSWRVAVGLRTFTMRPCKSRWFDLCPEGKRRCNGWHPLWEALAGQKDAEFIDGLLEGIGAGRYVRLDTCGKQGVVVTSAEKRAEWLENFPTLADVPLPRGPERARGRECTYDQPDVVAPGPAVVTAPEPRRPQVTREQIVVRRPDLRERCRCGSLTALAEGLCLSCRLASPAGQKRAADARRDHWIAQLQTKNDYGSRELLKNLIEQKTKEARDGL